MRNITPLIVCNAAGYFDERGGYNREHLSTGSEGLLTRPGSIKYVVIKSLTPC